jgi:hypothetical protein
MVEGYSIAKGCLMWFRNFTMHTSALDSTGKIYLYEVVLDVANLGHCKASHALFTARY